MINNTEFIGAQRAYLNNNRLPMEEEVDDVMNELWKLKRKVHNSYKDSHYDLYDLVWFIKKISMLTDDIAQKWEKDAGDIYLKTHLHPRSKPFTSQRKLELTNEEEDTDLDMSKLGELFH